MRSLFIGIILTGFTTLFAQELINVTFRYTAENPVVRVMLPGEFNNWGPNNNGVISPTAPSLMENEDGVWYKTIGLEVGGGSTIINSKNVYQYKIHEHYNSDGTSNSWFPDPLNPNTNPNDNNNSYIEITHPLIFQIQPASLKIVRDDQPAITATVAAKQSDSIDVDQSQIFINEQAIGNFTGYYDTEKQMLKIQSLAEYDARLNEGINELKIMTITKNGASSIDSVQINYVVNPDMVNEPLPDGMSDGINYHTDQTKVTLSLFAPYKKFVYLIGDFNSWTVTNSYFMKRDSISADSVRWWLTVEGLTPGKEYTFQYFIDDEIRIADPYADKILDPWNDQYINTATYPGLISYPSDKTTEIVSVFQTAQVPYEWQVADYIKPKRDKLVIYELLLRDFLEAHNYATLTDTLDYLQNLGINAIELMPVNEFDGNESWGYNPAFYFALDKYYGPKNTFKQFVDACHQRGLAVIMDMVLNHSYGQSPFVRLYNEGDYGKPLPENPWYNIESPNPTYSWGYDLNHESAATQTLVDRINRYWIEKYKVDGFRFDFTKGFTNKPGDGGGYDASRITILKRMADAIWETDSSAYIILEHFADNSEEIILADYGIMLWGNSNYNYNEATMGWISNSDFSWGYYENRGWSKPGLVTYMESHDEERLMYKNLQYGNSSGDYDITDISLALNRMKLAGAFFFTLPGPKMIWQFGELGYDFSIDYNGRVGNKPIHWDYFEEGERKKLYKTWAALLKLRNENETFTDPSTIVMASLSGAGKRINLIHSDLHATIVGNFDVQTISVNPNFNTTGTWYDYFSGDSIEIVNKTEPIPLEPGEFHIFTNNKLETPEKGILTNVESDILKVPAEFALEQNYPNPFNPTTTIGYSLKGPLSGQLSAISHVELTLYNALGQKVRTLVNGRQKSGKYSVSFEAAGLASGVYFYRLQAGKFVKTKKMILIH